MIPPNALLVKKEHKKAFIKIHDIVFIITNKALFKLKINVSPKWQISHYKEGKKSEKFSKFFHFSS
jgi:hypothetical protein